MDDNTQNAILAAIGHLGAAVVQTIPSDDQIIAGHVRDALEILEKLYRESRQ